MNMTMSSAAGRPPSYPAVVTTITTDGHGGGGTSGRSSSGNGNNETLAPLSGGGAPSTAAMGNNNKPPLPAERPTTLEAAVGVYERDGDAPASLEAFERLWGGSDGSSIGHPVDSAGGGEPSGNPTNTKGNDGANDANDAEDSDVPLSRRHNRAVLEHLSTLLPRSEVGDGGGPPRPVLHSKLSAILAKEEADGDDTNKGESERGGKECAQEGEFTTVKSKQKDRRKKKQDGQEQRREEQDLPKPSNVGESATLLEEHNRLVGVHNICLSHYARGNYREALAVAMAPFARAIKSIRIDRSDEGGKVVNVGGCDVTGDRNSASRSVDYLYITTRVAFLILDCHIALHSGNGIGLGPIVILGEGGAKVGGDGKDGTADATITAGRILTWIERNALAFASASKGGNDPGRGGSVTHDELKFRLHLYQSRVHFLGCREDDGDSLDSRTRLSRKELKNAMDIYQNKLCFVEEVSGKDNVGKKGGKLGSKGGGGSKATSNKGARSAQDGVSETTSVSGSLVTSVSDALWSEGKNGGGAGGGATRATFEGMPSKNKNAGVPQAQAVTQKKKDATPQLQVRHESVLYLKANLEYLRGNEAKSIKLCAEARSAGIKSRGAANGGHVDSSVDAKAGSSDDTQAASEHDEAIYYNNLALLHQSAGKIHLALHYYTFALSFMERVRSPDHGQANFWPNGLARPDISAEILHNTSVCAFQAREFQRAYECMARCVVMSPNVFGKRARCWLRLGQSCIGIYTDLLQKSSPTTVEVDSTIGNHALGSDEDIRDVSAYPLQRALYFLKRAVLVYFGNNDDGGPSASIDEVISMLTKEKASLGEGDIDCLESVLVSICYIKLQLKDPASAHAICVQLDLLCPGNTSEASSSASSSRLQLREMYAREAAVHSA